MAFSTSPMSVRPILKRRKLRKGTTSCWECKRRKVKCEYDEDTASCKLCLQRGLPCTTQELPEPVASFHSHARGPIRSDRNRLPTPGLSSHDSYIHNRIPGDLGKLTQHLLDVLPPHKDIELICNCSRTPSILAHEINTIPSAILQQSRDTTRDFLLDIPTIDNHPVLVAKYMLLLASFMQQLHPGFLEQIQRLSEAPHSIMKRLVEVAGVLVTRNDELIGTIEGVECIMIEGLYHMNSGNLRKAWMTVRRALSTAQLMGLNRSNSAVLKVIDHRTKYYQQHMWFKMVFLDRYLCLMLGLAQGCANRNVAMDALSEAQTTIERLERIHCDVAGRILERDESKPLIEDFELTRALDLEMQKAAKNPPSKWWLIPDLEATSNSPEESFWKTRKLFAQMIHYHILNKLHLPYMLRSMRAGSNYEYSLITCVNASREQLARWTALRRFNNTACSCRSVDFCALMAALTLMLAHLHGQRSGANILAHQYQSDRAMIEQVSETMTDLKRFQSDSLSTQSADLLQKLLAIDVEADGGGTGIVSVEEENADTATGDEINDSSVSVHIPYFGTIKITRGGMRRLRPPESNLAGDAPNGSSNLDTNDNIERAPELSPTPEILRERTTFENTGSNGRPGLPERWPSQLAGIEDWAFQGVDQAFFESVMGDVWDSGGESLDWGFV